MDFAPDSPDTVVFASGQSSPLMKIAFIGIPSSLAFAALTGATPLIAKIAVLGGMVLFVAVAVSILFSAAVLEVDTRRQRIRMTRSWFGRPARKIFEASFDQCDGVGVERVAGGEGADSYYPYLQLRNGSQHRIPGRGHGDPSNAERTLAGFIAATRLKRIDGPPGSAGLAKLPEEFRAPARGAIVVFEDTDNPIELGVVLLIGIAAAGYFGHSNEPLSTRAIIIGSALAVALVIIAIWMLARSIEIDTGSRRVRLIRSLLGYRLWTVFDVAFLECERVGVERVNYSTFRPFLQLRAGKRYTIPPVIRGYTRYWAPQQLADLFRLATDLPYRNDPPGPN